MTTTTAVKTSSVLCFDGQSTWVECGALELPSGDYTVEAWFQARSGGGALFEAAGRDAGVHLALDESGALACVHAASPAPDQRVSFITPASYRDGQWHHAAIVKGGEVLTLFVDGSPQGIVSGARPLSGPLSMSLGRRARAAQPSRGLRGALAEVRVWGRARSGEDVRGGLGSSLSGAEAELLRYYRLGDGRGKLARDHAAPGAAGTVHGTYVWREVPVAWAADQGTVRPAATSETAALAQPESPALRHRSRDRDQTSENTTGLQDYGHWKHLYRERDTSGDPPFRRGRIWA
ncbi:LamG-like jellyroll fold domain-containing protein [Sorangium sp. So ce233]|uniref:LamG-like jellyroll fold domain-containing protein n=1 Tax=Sorangium sp. So ce233 TaxID=3133290 RepID=UPI003F60CDE0